MIGQIKRLSKILTLLAATFLCCSYIPLPPNSVTTSKNSVTIPIMVIGKDQRGPPPKALEYVAEGIGILVRKGVKSKVKPYMCTAFCVSDAVIATNAHCLVRRNGKQIQHLDKMYFIRNPGFNAYRGGTAPSSSPLRLAAPDEPYLSFYTSFVQGKGFFLQAPHDWAFAQLRREICKGHKLDFTALNKNEVLRASKDGTIFLIGYHGDLDTRKGPYFSPHCKIRFRSDGQSMHHYCDTFKGSSGAPLLWLNDENDVKAIAINVGQYTQRKFRQFVNRRTGKRVGTPFAIAKVKHNFATQPEYFIDGVEAFTKTHLLKSKQEFLQFQALLKAAGYYKGSVDGKYGPATRAATIAYEKSLQQVPLGLPSQRMLRNLMSQFPGQYPQFVDTGKIDIKPPINLPW